MNAAVQEAVKGTKYRALHVQWNDAARTEGSCYGPNITDATLVKDGGGKVVVIRPENFNELICRIPSDKISVMRATPAGTLKPVTLATYLRTFGSDPATEQMVIDGKPLDHPMLDRDVAVRYQAVFVEAGANCVVTHFNYQATDAEARNALLLATTQGTGVSRDGRGTQHLFLKAPVAGKLTDHYMQIDKTRFGIKEKQLETAEERADLVAKGKAIAAVIGPQALGVVSNVLMVVQVPLKMSAPPARGFCGFGGGGIPKGAVPGAPMAAAASADGMRCRGGGGFARPPPAIGTSSVGRVSLGKPVGASEKVKITERDPTQRLTATVMLYYAVEGGVPSAADVKLAIEQLDALYAAGAGEALMGSGMTTDAAPTFKPGMPVEGHAAFPV